MEAGPLPLPSAPWQVEQRVVKMLRAAGESVALTPTGAVSAGLAVVTAGGGGVVTVVACSSGLSCLLHPASTANTANAANADVRRRPDWWRFMRPRHWGRASAVSSDFTLQVEANEHSNR